MDLSAFSHFISTYSYSDLELFSSIGVAFSLLLCYNLSLLIHFCNEFISIMTCSSRGLPLKWFEKLENHLSAKYLSYFKVLSCMLKLIVFLVFFSIGLLFTNCCENSRFWKGKSPKTNAITCKQYVWVGPQYAVSPRKPWKFRVGSKCIPTGAYCEILAFLLLF